VIRGTSQMGLVPHRAGNRHSVCMIVHDYGSFHLSTTTQVLRWIFDPGDPSKCFYTFFVLIALTLHAGLVMSHLWVLLSSNLSWTRTGRSRTLPSTDPTNLVCFLFSKRTKTGLKGPHSFSSFPPPRCPPKRIQVASCARTPLPHRESFVPRVLSPQTRQTRPSTLCLLAPRRGLHTRAVEHVLKAPIAIPIAITWISRQVTVRRMMNEVTI
jgi:hypothetical protein